MKTFFGWMWSSLRMEDLPYLEPCALMGVEIRQLLQAPGEICQKSIVPGPRRISRIWTSALIGFEIRQITRALEEICAIKNRWIDPPQPERGPHPSTGFFYGSPERAVGLVASRPTPTHGSRCDKSYGSLGRSVEKLFLRGSPSSPPAAQGPHPSTIFCWIAPGACARSMKTFFEGSLPHSFLWISPGKPARGPHPSNNIFDRPREGPVGFVVSRPPSALGSR